MKRILVVGAGFSGSTVARTLAENGYKVLVIDSRSHIAGNAFDPVMPQSYRYHKYGPHIFHTNNDKVFEFLSRFTRWNEYQHRVKAQIFNGDYVTFPANRDTIIAIGGKERIIDTFYRPYTKKMWGIDIEDLNPEILNRVPSRDDNSELYFPDAKYQCLPDGGYTELINKMLSHENITVYLETEFHTSMEEGFHHVFNSMSIDLYYGKILGDLPYRSIIFDHVKLPFNKIQPVATVNFTHNGPQTRSTEWSYFPHHGQFNDHTLLTIETPCDYKDNNYERYYPIKDKNGINRSLYEKYASIINEKVTFIGRCGLYAYLDMDQAVNSSLAIVNRFMKGDI